jgi:hypothetical protein
VISARAKGVSTVPVPLVVPGVQDPDDPDLLDHLPGAHRYLAAPVQRGASRRQNPGVPAPFGPNWPGPAVAAKLSMGVDARPEGPLASLGHLTKGELCREQALVFRCSRPSDTQTGKFPLNQTLLEHVGWLPVRNEFGPTVREMSHEFPLIVGEWCLEPMSAKAAAMPQSERLGFYRSLADAQLAAWDGTVG